MIVQVLYISVCRVTTSLFECQAHPGGRRTLTQYPGFVREPDDHGTLIPLGVVGILVCVVGVFSVFLPSWAPSSRTAASSSAP